MRVWKEPKVSEGKETRCTAYYLLEKIIMMIVIVDIVDGWWVVMNKISSPVLTS